MDQNTKQQVVEKLKNSSNVLVTVSSNPTVDDLAAAIGLSLLLSKLGKHATAVFSGAVPPAIEFLDPGKRFDKDVTGLRDFIIALDKAKADKLRYKVEDNVVKIFITPYKTTLTKDDLRFEEGDFNVDAVVALGVSKREDLDGAIKAHGRILHDATVMTVNAGADSSSLGAIDWQDPSAGSLCEMLVSITESFGSGLLDEQMSTAFLTGIVAETERFSNTKTSPKVMTMAAQLMAAGANQQLIATNLDLQPPTPEAPAVQTPPPVEPQPAEESDASQLTIDHDNNSNPPVADLPLPEVPAPEPTPVPPPPLPSPPPEPVLPPPPTSPPEPAPSPVEPPSQPAPEIPTPPPQAEPPAEANPAPPHDKTLQQLESEISDLAGGGTPPPSESSDPNANQKKTIMDSFNLPPSPASTEPGDTPAIDSRIKSTKGRGPRDIDENPSMGGTFNATSQQAHEENISDIKNSINATLLSHNEKKALDENDEPPADRPAGRAKDLKPLGSNLPSFEPTPVADTPATPPSPPVMPEMSPALPPEPAPPAPVPAAEPAANDIDAARRAVEEAVSNQPFDPANNPTQSVGAMPIQADQIPGQASPPVEIAIDPSGALQIPGAQPTSQPAPTENHQDFKLPTPPQ